MKPFAVYPLLDIDIQRSYGSYVWDQNDRRYLDFYGGHAVISIGHSHPRFLERITTQLSKMAFYSNSVQNGLARELADQLGQLSGYPEYSLFMVNSGAEAIENALKLASFKNGRTKVVAFRKGFHGRTSAAVRITDNDRIIAPLNKGFERILLPWNDSEAVEKVVAKQDVCAVVIEGIQGIGGINIPGPDFLKSLEQSCKKNGTILILDEIQSGYGRSGKFFAHQHAGIRPDLITIAKGMGNGFPIGGVLISPDFKAEYGLLGTTFGGTHLACAAGLAVLETIAQEGLLRNAELRGRQIITELSTLSGIAEIRGVGCMIGLEMPFPIKAFRKSLVEDFGVFTGTSSQPNTLRILPPLTVSEVEVTEFVAAFDHCLSVYKSTPEYEAFSIQ